MTVKNKSTINPKQPFDTKMRSYIKVIHGSCQYLKNVTSNKHIYQYNYKLRNQFYLNALISLKRLLIIQNNAFQNLNIYKL